MAFPVAHISLGCGIATLLGRRLTDWKQTLFWSLLSILPDFDFFFVFVLGLDWRQYHRTFSHSILFALVGSLLIFLLGRSMGYFNRARCWLAVFLVLLSHAALDFFCVSNFYRDGEMLFWPFSTTTWGHPSFLIPLYQAAGGDPTSLLKVAIPYTLLELALWSPVIVWVFSKQGQLPEFAGVFRSYKSLILTSTSRQAPWPKSLIATEDARDRRRP
ncbi:MAG: metal-dependent hydrolase [Acidobacteria bacterium]|nr:metal-dependent hydrolase [Acidobacteriota bacterium]